MARARYGEGELAEISPGVWRVAVERRPDPFRRDANGKAKRRRFVRIVRGKRSDAQKVKRQLEALRDEEAPGTSSTLRQISNEWYRRNLHLWDGQTPDNYRYAMRHLEPLMDEPVSAITRKRVSDLHAYWRETGLGEATIHKAHRVLVTILNQAVAWEAIQSNPASRAVKLAQPKGRSDSPPDDEALERFVDTADGDLLLFVGMVAVTGARLQEVLAIRWQDIDLGTGVLSLSGAMKGKSRATLVRGPLKNKKPRKVLLEAEMLDELRARHARLAAIVGEPAGYVFSLDPDGSEPWLPSSMGNKVRRLRDQLGIDPEKFWTHGLRHRAATKMLRAGVPLIEVAKTLGQEETTTLRFYAHAMDDVPDAAARVLGGVLSGRNDPLRDKDPTVGG